MDIPARAYKSATYLANRLDDRELPCPHFLGQGMRLCECIYQHPDIQCPFCFGTGVDPSSYINPREAA